MTDASDADAPAECDADEASTTESSDREPGLGLRWWLYPAHALTWVGGGVAIRFALESREWALVPVVMAWSLLSLWHWLYGVGVRYHRPLLRYLSVAADIALGGLLAAFAIDRAAPQVAAVDGEAIFRSLAAPLVWTAFATAASSGLILFHALFAQRDRA